jgi:hypothetical protein
MDKQKLETVLGDATRMISESRVEWDTVEKDIHELLEEDKNITFDYDQLLKKMEAERQKVERRVEEERARIQKEVAAGKERLADIKERLRNLKVVESDCAAKLQQLQQQHPHPSESTSTTEDKYKMLMQKYKEVVNGSVHTITPTIASVTSMTTAMTAPTNGASAAPTNGAPMAAPAPLLNLHPAMGRASTSTSSPQTEASPMQVSPTPSVVHSKEASTSSKDNEEHAPTTTTSVTPSRPSMLHPGMHTPDPKRPRQETVTFRVNGSTSVRPMTNAELRGLDMPAAVHPEWCGPIQRMNIQTTEFQKTTSILKRLSAADVDVSITAYLFQTKDGNRKYYAFRINDHDQVLKGYKALHDDLNLFLRGATTKNKNDDEVEDDNSDDDKEDELQ